MNDIIPHILTSIGGLLLTLLVFHLYYRVDELKRALDKKQDKPIEIEPINTFCCPKALRVKKTSFGDEL